MAAVSLRSSDDRMSVIKTAVKSLDSDVEIVSSEGDILLANSFLLSLASPFLHSLLVPLLPTDNQTSARIHLPDISKRSLSHLINILKQGFSTGPGTGNSIRQEVQEAARTLEFAELTVLTISLNNEYFEEDGDEYSIKLEVKKEEIKYEEDFIDFESPKEEEKENGKEADKCENNNTIATNEVEPESLPLAHQEPQQPSNAHSPLGNKAGPAETKRKLPKRKRKAFCGSFSDNSEDDFPEVQKGKKKYEAHDDKEYLCTKCDFKSRYKGHVKEHLEAVHDKVKYPCSQCAYKATKKSSLKRHVKSVHEKIKYPCSQCDHEATQLDNLNTHIKSIHERIKYPCSECHYEATQLGNLNTHIKSIHEKIKYPCSECDHEFTHKSHLKRHVKRKHDSDYEPERE